MGRKVLVRAPVTTPICGVGAFLWARGVGSVVSFGTIRIHYYHGGRELFVGWQNLSWLAEFCSNERIVDRFVGVSC